MDFARAVQMPGSSARIYQRTRRPRPRQPFTRVVRLLLGTAGLFGAVLAGGNSVSADDPFAGTPFVTSDDADRELAKDLLAGVDTADAAIAAVEGIVDKPTDQQAAGLRELDRRFAGSETAIQRKLSRRILKRLADNGGPRSLDYVHQVFETFPERRQHVAAALRRYADQQRRRAEDWRLLVRSLPILEGTEATRVMTSLSQFPQRGTKPEWQRQVILLGLRLSDEQGSRAALDLLEHWTNQPLDDLAAAQSWFATRHPDQPAPNLPVEAPGSRHSYAELLSLLQNNLRSQGDPVRGEKSYEKALCIRCHRYGPRGEAMGPDLTSSSRRYQIKEVLQALIYPSLAIPEEYAAQTVMDDRQRTYTGVVSAAADQVVVLQTNGQKVTLPRKTVRDIRPSRQSAMPSGLLDPLDQQEIVDLFAYLMQPRTAQR